MYAGGGAMPHINPISAILDGILYDSHAVHGVTDGRVVPPLAIHSWDSNIHKANLLPGNSVSHAIEDGIDIDGHVVTIDITKDTQYYG